MFVVNAAWHCLRITTGNPNMEVSNVKKLKSLEEDNRRLKTMFSDLSLEYQIKDILQNNGKTSDQQRAC